MLIRSFIGELLDVPKRRDRQGISRQIRRVVQSYTGHDRASRIHSYGPHWCINRSRAAPRLAYFAESTFWWSKSHWSRRRSVRPQDAPPLKAPFPPADSDATSIPTSGASWP